MDQSMIERFIQARADLLVASMSCIRFDVETEPADSEFEAEANENLYRYAKEYIRAWDKIERQKQVERWADDQLVRRDNDQMDTPIADEACQAVRDRAGSPTEIMPRVRDMDMVQRAQRDGVDNP